jgi:hypothetical protein
MDTYRLHPPTGIPVQDAAVGIGFGHLKKVDLKGFPQQLQDILWVDGPSLRPQYVNIISAFVDHLAVARDANRVHGT